KPAHVGDHRSFDKRHVERTRLHLQQRAAKENARDNSRQGDLENEFEPAADPFGLLLRDLEVIIGETERTEINHTEQGEPNETIVWTSPDKARYNDGSDDERATHGWGALFTAMQLGQAMNLCRQTNGLSQLQRGQFLNDEISTSQCDQESRHRRRNGAKRDVKENIEPNEVIAQVMEVVHHWETT